jgi:hypothetical protein
MVVATCLFALASCSGDGLSSSHFQAAIEHATCERAARCGLVTDVDTCERGTAWDDSQQLASLAAGRTGYDDERARACVDAVQAASCVDTGAAIPPCDDVFTGALADGDTCWFDFECGSERCVKVQCDRACCTGVCMERSGEGAACQAAADCSEGLVCEGLDGSPSTCHRRVARGGECASSSECDPGAYCAIELGPTDVPLGGTCLPRSAHAATCDGGFPSESCLGLDDYCDPDLLVCTARVAVGGTCDFLHAGLSRRGDSCRLESSCDADTRRCVAWPEAGAACRLEQCAAGYACDRNDMCVPAAVAPVCP